MYGNGVALRGSPSPKEEISFWRNKANLSAKELIPADENVCNSSAVSLAKEVKSDFAKQTQFFLKLKKQRSIYPL